MPSFWKGCARWWPWWLSNVARDWIPFDYRNFEFEWTAEPFNQDMSPWAASLHLLLISLDGGHHRHLSFSLLVSMIRKRSLIFIKHHHSIFEPVIFFLGLLLQGLNSWRRCAQWWPWWLLNTTWDWSPSDYRNFWAWMNREPVEPSNQDLRP